MTWLEPVKYNAHRLSNHIPKIVLRGKSPWKKWPRGEQQCLEVHTWEIAKSSSCCDAWHLEKNCKEVCAKKQGTKTTSLKDKFLFLVKSVSFSLNWHIKLSFLSFCAILFIPIARGEICWSFWFCQHVSSRILHLIFALLLFLSYWLWVT